MSPSRYKHFKNFKEQVTDIVSKYLLTKYLINESNFTMRDQSEHYK